jgi:hypothetical protein
VRKVLSSLDPYWVLLLVLSSFALLPLLADGYFYSAHDGRHSVFFVTMFDEAIRDGAWWPRWAMHHNQGYGYPTFVIQAPLAFYVAEVFVLLGVGVTNAVKIAWALGFLAGGWGMYALVRHWLLALCPAGGSGEAGAAANSDSVRNAHYARVGGLVAALLFVYAPYHLVDLYVRAAFAETMMFAWLPWVFLAFDRLIAGGSAPGWQGRLLVAALCYAGLLLTHVFALLAVTPLLAGFILFRLWLAWRRERGRPRTLDRLGPRVGLAAAGGLAALLLSAIFVLPLLAEGPLLAQEDWTRDTYAYERHWVYWGQFLSPFWGYGYSDDPAGANDGMSFQLGVIHVVLALAAASLLVQTAWGRHAPVAQTGARAPVEGEWGERAWLLLFLLVSSLVVLYTMTPAAAWLWRAIPMLEVVQFPWRFLLLTSLTLSALGGVVVGELGQRAQVVGAGETVAGGVLLALLVTLAGYSHSHPERLHPIEPWREDGRAVFQFEREHPDMLGYTRLVEERFSESPLSAQYLLEDFSNDKLERLGILSGAGQVLSHYSRGHSFGGEVAMQSAGVVQVRLFEFPGWQVWLDGEPVEHRPSPPYGLIELDVPAGQHRIDVRMGATPVRSLGMFVSGATLLILLATWGAGLWRQRGEGNHKV